MNFATKKPNIKKGATKPERNELFRSLIDRKNDPKSRRYGIGNAATGMKFKSIYLGQGRSDTTSQARLCKLITIAPRD